MLHVSYTGIRHAVLRYHCNGAHLNHGADWCISFGGLRTDEAVAREVLQAVGGNAVEAALEAAEQMRQKQSEQRKTLDMEVEQARYETRLASRRYEAVDPENRLVAGELESRWNASLRRVQELEAKIQRFDRDVNSVPLPIRRLFSALPRTCR